uniref:Transmembrane protein 184C n=1 Tax=Hydatigena taeniaeformis TaxID=6205 RepID=A0A0R3WTX6_HYDTA
LFYLNRICEVCKVYEETNFSPRYAYLYLTVINNISQIWALYCLVLFYQCTRAELKEMKPISKFICVKFVVFMSFWQSVLISILAASGVIRRVEAWKLEDERSICIAFQNFAVCIEMFIAAVGHHFAFTAAPYQDASAPRTPCCYSWWSMLDVSDVKRDVVQHVRHVGKLPISTALLPHTTKFDSISLRVPLAVFFHNQAMFF